FRTMPPDMLQGEALARVAQQNNLKSVAILAIDNDYGNGIVQAFQATTKQLGSSVVGEIVRYSPDASIYSIDLQTPFSEQPDAVLVIAPPDLGGDLLRTAFESGIWNGTTKILLPASMKTNGLAERAGRSTNGRYNASNVWGVALSSSPNLPQFRQLYQQRYGREPGPYDATTWDAAAIAALAAEAAQDTSGSAIRSRVAEVASDPGVEVSDICQALSLVREGKDINYQGTSGTVDFNQAGDAVGNYDVWTIDYTGGIKIESTVQAGSSTRPPKAAAQSSP
ncbi:MAG: ABC transporter substrate-binding protein, partial [Synechococcales cyanobacterium RM1_1_8]|nr:ABC transporter substrate-binding protein [Synechococcales cyanobacterium RM1_1_8]